MLRAIQDEDFVESMMAAYGGSEIKFLNAQEIDDLITSNEEVMRQYNDTFTEVTERLYEKYVN